MSLRFSQNINALQETSIQVWGPIGSNAVWSFQDVALWDYARLDTKHLFEDASKLPHDK